MLVAQKIVIVFLREFAVYHDAYHMFDQFTKIRNPCYDYPS